MKTVELNETSENNAQKESDLFKIALKVRDYECDMQGIVNNTVYMHYLEHSRHEFLNHIGFNWKSLIDKGIYLVAVKAEVEYKKALLSGQEFSVTCKLVSESKVKLKFVHEIYNEKNELILAGNMIAAFIDKDKKPIAIKDVMIETG
ncbi:MAG: acyl-CoA thioesterase [Proteobacteria bacterium]|nr:acyl-CoA thioesterase [Pseudomonadota bacterium]